MRHHHVFRQSWLGDFDLCPERARRQLLPRVRKESDSTAQGTAVHAAIEVALDELTHNGEPLAMVDANYVAQAEFTRLMHDPTFEWKQTDEPSAREFIWQAVQAFYGEVLPTLQPVATEIKFGPLALHEDEERTIEIEGTIDYLDKTGLIDWKTAGRKYQAWEKQRWAIQPTVYTFAAAVLGLIDAAPEVPFEYVVFLKTKPVKVQRVTVTRTPGDWAWLRTKALNVARLIETGLDAWPLNDTHALCSEKWCDFWSTCKGASASEAYPHNAVVRIGEEQSAH